MKFKTAFLILTLSMFALTISCKSDSKSSTTNDLEEALEAGEEAAEKAGEAIEEAVESTYDAAKEAEEVAKDEVKIIPIKFASGSTSKIMEGSITGRESIDYKLSVKEGQSLNISLAKESGMPYFNILEPGEEYEAIFNGSTYGNQFEDTAAKSGDYTIRVYMKRAAARRNETAKFRLETIVN